MRLQLDKQTETQSTFVCVCTHTHKHSHTHTPNTNTQVLQGDGAHDKRGFAHKEAVAAKAGVCLHRHLKLFPGGLGLENAV
jgi:hypothetical protein